MDDTNQPTAAIDTAPPALQSISRAPLVPEALLRRHACQIEGDTRFRAAARLRQSLWREEQGLPAGLHRPGGKRDLPRIRLGSLLQPADAARGLNFLSPAVHHFVRRSLVLREEGAAINYERLHRNLLSSEPLNFNLLAPLALNLDLATAVFRQLLPAFVHRVEAIRFETSPSRDRNDPRFLSDGTAFDAALSVVTPDGETATVFVECKYSESCSGPAAAYRPRYDEVSGAAGLYHDPEAKTLRSVQLEQFWRLHLLARQCVHHGLTPRAHLLVLHPRLNRQVATTTRLYAAELIDPVGSSDTSIGFSALTLETFVAALAQAGGGAEAAYLTHRYLDLTPVLDLVLAEPADTGDGPPSPGPVLALPAPSSPPASDTPKPSEPMLPAKARKARPGSQKRSSRTASERSPTSSSKPRSAQTQTARTSSSAKRRPASSALDCRALQEGR